MALKSMLWLAMAVLSVSCARPTAASAGETRLPAVWRQADALSVERAETVAKMDSWAKLGEFVAGIEVTGAISVRDLIDVDRRLLGDMTARLTGISEQDLLYHDGGVVQCRLAVDMEQLQAFLEEGLADEISGLEGPHFQNIPSSPDGAKLVVWGNAALPESEGLEIVRAIRAAEMDAAMLMAAKLEGVELGRRTRVGDFMLVSDEIKACVADFLKGLRFDRYTVTPSVVEVDAEISFVRVIERIRRVHEDFDADVCPGCPDASAFDFDEAASREELLVHRVTGKAARTPVLETRQPNAGKAIEAARKARLP